MEKWKDITGYENYYSISNYGRVKSLSRNVGHSIKESILKLSISKNGYFIVDLFKKGERKTHYVHRLVSTEFCENNNMFNCVNHKDENKLNNHYTNLEWCNYQYNNTFGKMKNIHDIPVIMIDKKNNELKEFKSINDAAINTNQKSSSNISSCCNGKRITAGGYKWRYAI
jgi:hypothetical protein